MKKLLIFVFICSLLVACNKKIEDTKKPGQSVNVVKADENTTNPLLQKVEEENIETKTETAENVNKEDYSNLSQEELNSKLIEAIDEQDAEKVKNLLTAGANANTCTSDWKQTPVLVNAVRNGHTEIVKLLLDANADANAATEGDGDGDYDNSLMLAAEKGYTEIFKFLLTTGADVNAEKWCNSVLTIAIEGCHLDIVKELIKADVDVNAEVDCSEGHGVEPGTNMRSPLHIAIETAIKDPDCTDIVEELLKAGVTQSIKGEELLFAINENANVLVNMLQKYGAKDTLFTTIARNNMEQFKKLLKKANSEDKNRALNVAISSDNISMLKDLIADGANVNGSVLSYAAKHGNLEIVKILLETGIDPNYEKCDCPECDYQDANLDDQPLIMASAYGHLEIVEELLKAGAEPNTACKYTNGRPLELVCLWAKPKPDDETCSKIREELLKSAGAKE